MREANYKQQKKTTAQYIEGIYVLNAFILNMNRTFCANNRNKKIRIME